MEKLITTFTLFRLGTFSFHTLVTKCNAIFNIVLKDWREMHCDLTEHTTIGKGAVAHVVTLGSEIVAKQTRLSWIDRWILHTGPNWFIGVCATGWRGWALDLLIQAYIISAYGNRDTAAKIFATSVHFSYCSTTKQIQQIQPRFETTFARYLQSLPQDNILADTIFHNILSKVRTMHNLGIIHHDLKAENWLVQTNSRGAITTLVISDFDKASMHIMNNTQIFEGRFYNKQFSLLSHWIWLQRVQWNVSNASRQYQWFPLPFPLTKLSWRAAQPMLMHFWSCQDPVFAQSNDIYLILLSIFLSTAGWRKYPQWWLYLWPTRTEAKRLWIATLQPLADRVSTRQIIQWLCENKATCRIFY